MTRLSDAAAFLAAIRDRPDDPVPWLVFADWLAERGHPLEPTCRRRADRLELLRPGRGIRDRRREFHRRCGSAAAEQLAGDTPADRWLAWEDPETAPADRLRLLAGHCTAAGDPRTFVGGVARFLAATAADPGPAYRGALRVCEDYAAGDDVSARLDGAVAALRAEAAGPHGDLDRALANGLDYFGLTDVLRALGGPGPIGAIMSRLDSAAWHSDRHRAAALRVLTENPFPPPS